MNSISLKMILLFLFFLAPFGEAFAQVVEDLDKPSEKKLLSQITKESLLKELSEFQTKDISELEEVISKYNQRVAYYIQSRDKECKGFFSSVEINSNGESEIVRRKLSKEERKLCLLELIHFRKKYVSEIFKVRKKLLLFEHNKQIENLNSLRAKSISSLDQLATKLTNSGSPSKKN